MGEKTRLDDDSVARVHGTVQDITLWKEAELAASVLGNRFAQLTRSLPIIVWTAHPEGSIDYFNDALLEYTGTVAEELLADQVAGIQWVGDLEEGPAPGAAPVVHGWGPQMLGGGDLGLLLLLGLARYL